ncbi:hypothetical protein L6R29_13745 [Myxococcota bacterium]|nr:hypothetical protein [Myxococcota bacterium]
MLFSQPWELFKRSLAVAALGILLVAQTGCPENTPQPEGQTEKTTDGGDTEKTTVDKRQCGKDSDCPTDQPRCNNGFCEAIPSQCKVDADCNDPNRVCQNGQCVDKQAPECKTDADCRSKAPRTSCNTTSGQCVEPVQRKCTANADCTDPTKPLCNTGTGTCEACPSGETFCADKCVNLQTDLANCGACGKACGVGTKCEAGTCKPATPCQNGETDCNGVCVNLQTDLTNCGTCGNRCGLGANCEAGACKPLTKPCQSDADCAANEVCEANGVCAPKGGCRSDDDCKADPTKPVCDVTRGVCVAAPPECTSDADCANKAPKTKCDAATGKCVEPPPECQTNADCKDPARPVCVQNKCAPSTGCRSNADCTADPAKKICNVPDGQCYACVASTDCLSYQECDAGTKTCKLKAGFCVIDSDCKADPSKPACVGNTCVECKAKADCKVQFDCQANKCVFVGCAADNECAAPTPYCKVAEKKCVICTTNAHCSASQICNTTTNVCEAKPDCVNDAECATSTAGKFCNTTTKKCVECLTNANCTNNRQCQNNVCVECTQDTDCSAGQICTASKCVVGCRRDRDCPANQICDAQQLKCVVGCRSNADCASNYTCQNSVCVATCASTQDCFNASNSAPTCTSQAVCGADSVCLQGRCRALACRTTPTPAQCVMCVQSSDCQRYGNDFFRVRPACIASNRCGCNANTQCTAFNAGAVGGVCDTAKSECIGCKADTDCRRGYICNSTNALCEVGCRTDNECPSSQYCVSNKCVECKTNANCTTDPTRPVCNTSGACVGCNANSDCTAAGKNVCLNSLCVQCTQDSHCTTAPNTKCDVVSNTCYNPALPTQCQPCGANNACAPNHRCYEYRTQGSGTVRERMCAKNCQSNTDCAKGYVCGPRIGFDPREPQTTGLCYPAYTFSYGSSGNIAYISCTALVDQGKACTASDQCGAAGIDDAYCDTYQGRTCRVTCRFDNSNTCPTGYTCACPANFRRSGDTTCQGTGSTGGQITLRATCVK